MPGLPDGKPAGVRCPHLDASFACLLWQDPRRPDVCAEFKPEPLFCGNTRSEALDILTLIEESA